MFQQNNNKTSEEALWVTKSKYPLSPNILFVQIALLVMVSLGLLIIFIIVITNFLLASATNFVLVTLQTLCFVTVSAFNAN